MHEAPKHGEFGWHRIMADETSTASQFYTQLFNWTPFENVDVNGASYTLFKSGHKIVAGLRDIPPEMANQVIPHWMSFITVDDINEVSEKAKGLGAELRYPIVSVENLGLIRVIQDPSSVYVGLIQFYK